MAAKSATKLQLVRKADPTVSSSSSSLNSSVQKTRQKKPSSAQSKARKTNSAQKSAGAKNRANHSKSQARTARASAQNTAWTAAFPSNFKLSFNPQMMENLMAQSRSHMDKQSEKMDKMAQDASALGREQFDAVMKSCNSFARGCEDLFRTSLSIAQNAAERQTQFMKQAMSSKTINEWAEVQNKIAQANFDDFMNGATKISEMSVKIMTECTEPLNDQLGKSIKRTSESMAA
ncbi:MAG: phasin family protein [Alphaproteobacteria bacterium]|nr:phasin family protein [Alphaproteobacteria bacterium]